MNLKQTQTGFSLLHNIVEKRKLKDIPISTEFPSKPLVIQNVIDRLGIRDLTIAPMKERALPEFFFYHTEPKPFQHDALVRLWTYRGLNLLLDPGLGKTKVLLDYIFLRKPEKTLIVCPSPLKGVWEEEMAKHRPELSLTAINDGKDEFSGNILVMSYGMLRNRFSELLKWRAELIILDEALIQNNSKTAHFALDLAKFSKERILASGSLVNNGPANLYYPLRFSEPSLVGGSFNRFKERYLITQKTSVPGNDGKRKSISVPTGKTKNLEELRSIVRATSIIMRKEEVLKDLPEQHFEEIHIDMPPEYRYQWDNIYSNAMLDVKGYDLIPLGNPLVIASRLAQLSAGFFYMENKVPWFLPDQPKIDVLLKHVTNSRERGIIWIRYNAQSVLVEKALEEAGVTFLTVNGRTKDVPKTVRDFNNSDSVQFLVAQERVLNYGHTVLGNANDDDYLPLCSAVKEQHLLTESYSYQVTTQQIGRTHRIGSLCEPYYYRYLMTPLDYKVRATLDERRDVSETVLMHFLQELRQGSKK